jgi:predicted PolB exonuclease-like 3'-5' exonuclease
VARGDANAHATDKEGRLMSAPFLILDLETVPDLELWTPPPPDPEGPDIFAPIWAHRIVTIGCALLGDDCRLARINVITAAASEDPDARELALIDGLSRFVDRSSPTVVTYNGRGFDLQVLSLRSLRHGLPMAWFHDNSNARSRYSERYHIDLCDSLSHNGAGRRIGLDDLAKLIGLPGKVGIDGSQVGELYRAGKLDEIERYCLSDVAQTALLFLRFRRLQGRLNAIAYYETVGELIAKLGAEARFGELVAAINTERLLGPKPRGDAPPAKEEP